MIAPTAVSVVVRSRPGGKSDMGEESISSSAVRSES
jgi:hypothetical protein